MGYGYKKLNYSCHINIWLLHILFYKVIFDHLKSKNNIPFVEKSYIIPFAKHLYSRAKKGMDDLLLKVGCSRVALSLRHHTHCCVGAEYFLCQENVQIFKEREVCWYRLREI